MINIDNYALYDPVYEINSNPSKKQAEEAKAIEEKYKKLLSEKNQNKASRKAIAYKQI